MVLATAQPAQVTLLLKKKLEMGHPTGPVLRQDPKTGPHERPIFPGKTD
jgi:hypothetical protein